MDLDTASNMYTISKKFQQYIIIIDESDYETSRSNSTSPQPQIRDPSKNQHRISLKES